MAGWDYAVTYGEFLAWMHATSFMNANRDTKTHPDPVDLPTPWRQKQQVDVTAEEREALRADLRSRSAFAH